MYTIDQQAKVDISAAESFELSTQPSDEGKRNPLWIMGMRSASSGAMAALVSLSGCRSRLIWERVARMPEAAAGSRPSSMTSPYLSSLYRSEEEKSLPTCFFFLFFVARNFPIDFYSINEPSSRTSKSLEK